METGNHILTVLLVEDEELIQDLFRMEFAKLGFKIFVSATMQEGLSIVQNKANCIDVCLIDHMLPDGSGLDLLNQIKAINADLPVIMITGNGGREVFEAALNGGAFEYIEKPFSIEKDVIPPIRRLISTFKLKQENSYLNEQILHNSKLAALGELSATVVHDIRGPLAMIQVTCEDLMDEFEETQCLTKEVLQQHIGQITKASQKIKKLVEHLRTYARNDKNEQEETKKISSLLEDSLFLVEQKIRKFGIKAHIRIDPPLLNAELMCFPNKIEQVLMNLMSNACDAMHNTDKKELTAIAKSEHGFLLLSVADTGTGIPPEVMPKIFESFFTTKPKDEGTGLGLSIVRGIVREHDGDLLVDSVMGKGTTFTIKLSTTKLIIAQPSNVL